MHLFLPGHSNCRPTFQPVNERKHIQQPSHAKFETPKAKTVVFVNWPMAQPQKLKNYKAAKMIQ